MYAGMPASVRLYVCLCVFVMCDEMGIKATCKNTHAYSRNIRQLENATKLYLISYFIERERVPSPPCYINPSIEDELYFYDSQKSNLLQTKSIMSLKRM